MSDNKLGFIKIVEGWNDADSKMKHKRNKPTNSFNVYFCLLCGRYMKASRSGEVI